MAFLSIFYTILLITTAVLSAPATLPAAKLKGRSFEVQRVRRAGYVPHGPAALRKAYRKFNITATHLGLEALDFEPIKLTSNALGTQSAAAKNSTENGTVAAVATSGDTEFVAAVSIGGQTLMLDFDTGSSDLWVFNTQLPAKAQNGHTIYDPSKSTTFQEMDGATFDISYGDGSGAAGNVGTDVVNIGGASVNKQAVELATEVSSAFVQDTASNGLVGLAFSTLNTVQPTQQQTFFENIASQLDEPVLAASLKSDSSSGSYQFGTIDTAKFTGELANISVDNSNGFWQFDSAAFKIGDGDMQAITQSPTAIADTGTTLMLVSPEVAAAYYEQVQGAQDSESVGGYIYPCSSELPTLSIAVGNSNLATVPTSVLNYSTIGMDRSTGEEYCYGGVQSNSGSEFQIFGDVFLKSMYVVFDQRGPSLGLATPA
ncbi:putative aspergillopepsin A-like aspartic endopeptidase [Talaromyces atroroseus]|uniref:Putative aspergillopepsin A-like aspartic endopeptidase n=1 Tax=Talaromyces atroroseus TaxID=1441469 RepID=A0A225B821_TALAT|nr:putative aspergillopepsin A-like aspartic endopeptidase [Talaromyces atroroseus]OKL64239.1 putative aspergillopepsin A-like aspartic endopeptidase [Talaromyces atroroseus]